MRTLFFTLLLSILALPAFAQVEAKINVGSAITGGINLSADFALSPNTSLAAGLGYASTRVTIDEEDEFSYNRFRIVPEFRYYFNPRLGADRFFTGAYGRLAFVDIKNTENGDNANVTRAALGVMVGSKWVYDSGFVFELNGGVGRGTTFGAGNEGQVASSALNVLTGIDLRLGIIVGYRFGQ